MAIRLYRKDDLDGFIVSPTKNKDGSIKETARQVADRLISTAGYTESQKEAQDASTTLGGVNYTGSPTSTTADSSSTQLSESAKK